MYRQHTSEKAAEEQFVARLFGLPVMTAAIGQLTTVYSSTKERNRLFRFTLETAESGVYMVVGTAKPYMDKFEKPIGALNAIACDQLDKLEHSYPIITRPADEVVKETKGLCDSAVKPLVDRVMSVKQYGVDKVTNVKTYTCDTINGVKAYGVNKVTSVAKLGTSQVTRMLDTPLGHGVLAKVDIALKVADQYVESYLPELETNESLSEKKCEEKVEPVVLDKAWSLGCKVRCRVYGHMANRMRHVQKRSKESIDRLNFTVDMIQYAQGNLNSAAGKAQYLWEEINKSENQVAEEVAEKTTVHTNSTFERRAIATARHLTQKLKATMVRLGFPADRLPAVWGEQVRRGQELSQRLVDTFSNKKSFGDHPAAALVNARTYLSTLEETIYTLGDWAARITPIAFLMPSLKKRSTSESTTSSVDLTNSTGDQTSDASDSRSNSDLFHHEAKEYNDEMKEEDD